jgi:hypothetical protein
MPKTDKQQDKIAVTSSSSTSANEAQPEATVLPAAVHFALDVLDRGHATAFGALHDARTELRIAVDGGLDWADKSVAAALRFARKLVHRTDDLAAETLGGAERVLTTTVATARSSALAAAHRLAEARAASALEAAPAPAHAQA